MSSVYLTADEKKARNGVVSVLPDKKKKTPKRKEIPEETVRPLSKKEERKLKKLQVRKGCNCDLLPLRLRLMMAFAIGGEGEEEAHEDGV